MVPSSVGLIFPPIIPASAIGIYWLATRKFGIPVYIPFKELPSSNHNDMAQ